MKKSNKNPSAYSIVKDYPYPTLARSVLRALGYNEGTELLDALRDVSTHGADSGWSGFTYYSETVAFCKRHRKDIVARIEQDADDMGGADTGVDGAASLVKSFVCLHDEYTTDECARALYGRYDEKLDVIYNALAWYALEDVARYVSDAMDNLENFCEEDEE